MLRLQLAILFLALSGKIIAQPPLNEWYSFARTQSGLGSVVSTDSAYYVLGVAASTTTPTVWDAVFARIGFDGSIEMESFLHNDTVSTRPYGYTNLEPTHDHNFVALAEYGKYFLFIKYSPSGDTIYTRLINEFYDLDSNDSVWPSTIIELDDSSFMCLAMLGSEETNETYFVLFHLSEDGDLNSYNLYAMNLPEYWTMYPGGMTKTDYGYLITGNPVKPSGSVQNHLYNFRYIKTDHNGILIDTYTELDYILELNPRGILNTYDGGYLHGGSTGFYNSTWNALEFEAQIIKLNPDFSREWVIKIGIPTNANLVQCTNIREIDSTEFIAAGYCYADSASVGWLVKFNLDGELIWDSYFSFVLAVSPGNFPEHEVQDLQITADNGYLMCGIAWDKLLTNVGTPGRFGWLFKTDSVGCLVPGCQDFFGIEENLSNVRLGVYPNPAADFLNIYYYDENFSGNTRMEIYDMSGKLVHSWRVHSNDMAYIYDLSNLTSGHYIIRIVDGEIEIAAEKFVKIN